MILGTHVTAGRRDAVHIIPAMRLILFLVISLGLAAAQAPAPSPQVWQMQDSGSTASLRGIDSVDGTVAWASGSGGTVLRLSLIHI